MRIISGKFKGLNLHSPKDNEIRPTSDRLRESLFSIIGSEKYNTNILNANVIDICTGTGALGIEALSRGASNLFLIDMAQDAIEIVKKNISKMINFSPYGGHWHAAWEIFNDNKIFGVGLKNFRNKEKVLGSVLIISIIIPELLNIVQTKLLAHYSTTIFIIFVLFAFSVCLFF